MKIKLLKFKKVKSTNDVAIKLIKKDLLKPTLIFSEQQTKGRGTMGKKWISSKGNLFLSILFLINSKKINYKQFALLNAYLIKRILSKFIFKKINIKWPNDLLIDKKKVCGVLQEVISYREKNFLIVGIGINTLTCPKNNSFKSISLLECSNKLIDNSKIIKSLKRNYETIFYNYRFNKLLLNKA